MSAPVEVTPLVPLDTTAATRTIVIATRGSPLALAQAGMVRDALVACHPGLQARLERITTTGDARQDAPISAIGGQGAFVRQIEQAVQRRRADLAVHSAKDLPSQLADGLCIGAVPLRADARDVLVSRGDEPLHALPHGARVGTGSPRRACQLRALRPDLVIADIRGNVDTRLRRLAAGDYDALVLAAAGLQRLGLTDVVSEWLEPDVMLPAVAQGALAVETRADDDETRALVAAIDDAATADAVTAERGFLRRLGADCSAAVAAHAIAGPNESLILRGLIAIEERVVRGTISGSKASAAALGTELGAELLALAVRSRRT